MVNCCVRTKWMTPNEVLHRLRSIVEKYFSYTRDKYNFYVET